MEKNVSNLQPDDHSLLMMTYTLLIGGLVKPLVASHPSCRNKGRVSPCDAKHCINLGGHKSPCSSLANHESAMTIIDEGENDHKQWFIIVHHSSS